MVNFSFGLTSFYEKNYNEIFFFFSKNELTNIHLQIITAMPIMRTLRQRIMSTMMTRRKVEWTSASEKSSLVLFSGITVPMSTKGGSIIINH